MSKIATQPKAQRRADDAVADPPGYRRTDVGLIPEDWHCDRLGDSVNRVGSGITPTGGERVYKLEGRPFLRSQNIGWGELRVDDLAFIDEETHASFAASEIKEGDVLLNITGASIGRSAVADIRIARGNVNQHVCEIRTNRGKLDPHYLNNYLLSAVGQKQIDSFQAGGNRQGLNYNQIRSFLIPRPDPGEQRAIAAALSDVDGSIGALDKLITKKRAIKQAAMQQLLTGKTRLPGFGKNAGHKDTEVGVIPEDWDVRRLSECLHKSPGYGINAPAVTYDDALPTYLRITDIDEDGHFAPKPRVSVRHADAAAYYLEEGDLVFARTGASVGKSYLYKPTDGPLVFAGFLICVKPAPSILDPTFLSYYVQSKAYWDWVFMMSVRSGQPGINGQEYGFLELPVPRPDEQRAIATALSDMDAEIDALGRRRDKTKAIKQGMMQALLTGRVRLLKQGADA